MLEIDKSLTEIQEQYQDSRSKSKFNYLITGHFGSGKTTILETCPRPVLVHSFDPNGALSLDPELTKKGGPIIVDNRFEFADILDSEVIIRWQTEYNRLKKAGIFDKIGTYAIDSLTGISYDVSLKVLKTAKRISGEELAQFKLNTGKSETYVSVDGMMHQQDYQPLMAMVENTVRNALRLPCCIVVTAHLQKDKDEVTGKESCFPMVAGNLRQRLPTLFDEVYVMDVQEGATGNKHRLLTRINAPYYARTRMGRRGKFDMYEEPDIKKLMLKAGVKPLEFV